MKRKYVLFRKYEKKVLQSALPSNLSSDFPSPSGIPALLGTSL
jgi:hypothetical protein